MPTPAAFISYARSDDSAYGGRITGLRQRLERMVGAAIGRDFEIFQDCEGIAWGQHWRSRLDEALGQALFLIPIITPGFFNSEACCAELEAFLDLERRSGRNDRILPVYFLSSPVFEQNSHVLATALRERQYRDWRQLRVASPGSPKVLRALDSLANEIAAATHRLVTPPARGGEIDELVARVKPEHAAGELNTGFGSETPARILRPGRSSRKSTRRGAQSWW